MVICRVCKVELTKDNWSNYRREHRPNLCKSCNVKKTQAWRKEHPTAKTKRRKGYMTDYMREYRKTEQGLENIRASVRKEQHRRYRELPTNTILNEHFEGSHLHHMTPFIAAYIPKELHRSVYHNLKTGIGMIEINAKVTQWLANP